MGRACIFSLSLIFLLIACTQQLGVLYVNDIIGNSDFANVLIEQSIINDNSLVTTYINGLVDCATPRTPCGVYVEQVNYFDGNVEVPVNLEVFINTTVEGTFYPNGGIFSDAIPNGGYSFLVEDNTGNTGMTGELRLYGGLSADGGVFTVDDVTGQTTVSRALFKPNGGIDVQNGQFTVAKEDGTFFTTSFANVVGDFYLGTSKSEDRYITRYAASSSYGGDTLLLGQSVEPTAVIGNSNQNIGGDIILEPGVGQNRKIGKIILGRQANDNLYFGRPPVDISGTSGGDTTFQGQDSFYGDGGDIVLSSGDSTSAGNGGDIILDVGYSPSGAHGEIIIGNTASPFYDILLYRPSVPQNAGSTYISGQSTNAGLAGDLYLRAAGIVDLNPPIDPGSLTRLDGTPGDIILSPGNRGYLSTDQEQGDIILGRSTPVDLIVKRFPVLENNVAAGDTTIQAVTSSINGNGGSLFLQAGDAGNGGNGGDVYLKNADTAAFVGSNNIYWGNELNANRPLIVQRASSRGAGGSTSILGQESVSSNGGTLEIVTGYGSINAGNLNVKAGAGTKDDGGSITFTGGDGNQNGGLVTFAAGSSAAGAAGGITLTSGSASIAQPGTKAGNIYLNAGSGATLGDVQILNARNALLSTTSVTLFDYLEIVSSSQDDIIIQANPESVVSYNGQTLLKDRIFNVQQVPNVFLNYVVGQEPLDFPLVAVQQMQYLQDTVQNLINTLSQCGHGLFSVPEGSNFACILPGSVPTPISRPV